MTLFEDDNLDQIIEICKKVVEKFPKDLNGVAYDPIIKNNKDAIFEYTKHFPEAITLKYRVKALSKDLKDIYCPECGTVINNVSSKLCSRECKLNNKHYMIHGRLHYWLTESQLSHTFLRVGYDRYYPFIYKVLEQIYDHVDIRNNSGYILSVINDLIYYEPKMSAETIANNIITLLTVMKDETAKERYEYQVLKYGHKEAVHRVTLRSALRCGSSNPGFEHGGRLSPFSNKNPNRTPEQVQECKDKIKHRLQTDKSACSNNIESWIKKTDGDIELAKELYELQKEKTKFSLKKCIERYGEEAGTLKWKQRQEKWLATLDAKSDEEKIEINRKKANIRRSSSSISKNEKHLYEQLKTLVPDPDKLDNQLRIKINDSLKFFIYDIVYKNKIIEYNGTFWHCHPDIYSADYYHDYVKKTAKEIWERDAKKHRLAQEQGYEIFVVWENDYNKDKAKLVQSCLEFLTA